MLVPYIRNTLNGSIKTTTREEALIDIYRVMRPGEPTTIESADTHCLNHYSLILSVMILSAVGRVKMNMRVLIWMSRRYCSQFYQRRHFECC